MAPFYSSGLVGVLNSFVAAATRPSSLIFFQPRVTLPQPGLSPLREGVRKGAGEAGSLPRTPSILSMSFL